MKAIAMFNNKGEIQTVKPNKNHHLHLAQDEQQ